MKTKDVMLKTLKLAQSQLGKYKSLLPRECAHEYSLYAVDCVTLAPRERKCGLCGKIQRATTVWVDA